MFWQKLQEKIEKMVETDPANSYQGEWRFYHAPLLGVARADDPLFEEMKEEHIVGEKHLMPEEWLPGAAAVISYFLPFSQTVRSSNHGPRKASLEWMHARFLGEDFNDLVRNAIIREVESQGEKAIAPALDERMDVDYLSFSSNWSERHVAMVAGLGTFSLNKGLITARGMAGRFGSVINTLDLEPSPRDFNDPFQYCLALMDGACGDCIERCPADAIGPEGKDKMKCFQYLFAEDPLREEREPFGYPFSACGKCQTNVACENSIP